MAKKSKVEGSLYTNDKNEVAHVYDKMRRWSGVFDFEFALIPGTDTDRLSEEEFRERFPYKVDRIEVVRE